MYLEGLEVIDNQYRGAIIVGTQPVEGSIEGSTLLLEAADSGVSGGGLLVDDGVVAEDKIGIAVIGAINS